jgi:SOS response regulatory protein OraA/RecX
MTATVTALRRRGRSDVEVLLDGQPWRRFPDEVVSRGGLFVGAQLDRERIRTLARARRRYRAVEAAARALRARDHSAASLTERLTARGLDRSTVGDTVDMLARVGLVNDVGAAARRAGVLCERGLGDAAIVADLDGRGFAREAVRDAVDGLEPEGVRAAAIVEREGPTRRTLAALARRGFSEDALEGLIAAVGEGEIA